MEELQMRTRLAMIVLGVFVVITSFTPAYAQDSGHAYIVQPGDWLSKIAFEVYGDVRAYARIVEATNAKAQTDSSFAVITDPNKIEVGQKLWLPDASTAELEAAFKRAVQDAAVADASEISRDLISITDAQPNLLWQGEGEDKRVLVVTWTSFAGYDENIGKPMTLAVQVFVTAVPEIKDFCATDPTPPAGSVLRLEQLLGLPPNNGKNRWVELWAKPIDLFRPSPDPEITDDEAELDFRNSKQLTTSTDYIAWFNDLKSKSYGENGYPWTRLGYTYDWGNPTTRVGASEFVIEKGAEVLVNAVTSNDAYCP
jgi:hypothetical protein